MKQAATLFLRGGLLRVPVTFDGRVRLSQLGLGKRHVFRVGKKNWDAATKRSPAHPPLKPKCHKNKNKLSQQFRLTTRTCTAV